MQGTRVKTIKEAGNRGVMNMDEGTRVKMIKDAGNMGVMNMDSGGQ